MINKELLASIFKTYSIQSVTLVETDSSSDFIVSKMSEDFSIERWEYLENILKDLLKKDINIIPYNQANEYLGTSYLEKGVTIL